MHADNIEGQQLYNHQKDKFIYQEFAHRAVELSMSSEQHQIEEGEESASKEMNISDEESLDSGAEIEDGAGY